ncbi:MAG: hypothetical protein EXQ58_01105 [Acidobacteria bacterium]|nr:hypothetical protein [Acidobacteriota bacterium]
MHQLGYRMKRASDSYLQTKNEEAQQLRRALKRLCSLKANGTVVFQDETGSTLHPRLGFGWAQPGKRWRIAATS